MFFGYLLALPRGQDPTSSRPPESRTLHNSDLESKSIPDRGLETKPACTSHREGGGTPTRAARVHASLSAPGRNCTSVTPVRSRLLYLLSYRGKKASCAGIEPALPDGESGVLGHWTNTTCSARGWDRTSELRGVVPTICH